MTKPTQFQFVVKHVEIDLEKISEGFGITSDEMAKFLYDARMSYGYVEHWSCILFDIQRHGNSNHPKSDGQTRHKFLPSDVSIKCLTDRVRVQKSSNQGGARKCTPSDLEDAVTSVPYFIIADMGNLPQVVFFLISSRLLKHWIDRGELSYTGLNRKKFLDLLLRDAKPKETTLPRSEWAKGHDASHLGQMGLELDPRPQSLAEESSASKTLVNMVRDVISAGKLRGRYIPPTEGGPHINGIQRENGQYFAIDAREKSRYHVWSPMPAKEGRHGVVRVTDRNGFKNPPQFPESIMPHGAKTPPWFIQFKNPQEALEFIRSG